MRRGYREVGKADSVEFNVKLCSQSLAVSVLDGGMFPSYFFWFLGAHGGKISGNKTMVWVCNPTLGEKTPPLLTPISCVKINNNCSRLETGLFTNRTTIARLIMLPTAVSLAVCLLKWEQIAVFCC